MKEPLLISACLLGRNCKYNGGNNYVPAVEALKGRYELIPVCPECFGGLPIPHDPSERVGDRVLSRTGADVTAAFVKGAGAHPGNRPKARRGPGAAEGAQPLLRLRDPVYDGTFTGTVVPGNGVAAELLLENGVKIYGESRIGELLK